MKKTFFTLVLLISSLLSFSLNVPSLSSPSNVAVNQNPNVTLSIGSVTGATSYDYEIDINSDFLSSVVINRTSTTCPLSELLFGQTYYWRARARNATETSDWSAHRSFTIINTVFLSNPSNGATDRNPNVALSWSTITGLTHYDYQYDTSPEFDSPNLFSGAVTSNFTSVSTSNLLFGETYYWRVRARHDVDQSGWSDVRSFTVINTVYLGNPSNGAIDRNPNVALSWTTVTGLTHYDYQYDTSSDFDSPNLFSGAVTSNYTSVSTSNLLFGETYYWRVRARHDVDQSGWSDVRSFTVINTVYLSGPANGNTLRPVNQVLSWNSITGLTHYDYNYDTSDQFDSPNYFFGSVTSNYTSVSTANLMYGTNYNWRVKARHSLDESEWSAVWNFTTNPLGAVQGSPSNNATNRPINLTLSVSITSGSSNIDYQLDTTSNFNSPLLREYTHTNSFSGQTVSNLRYGQTYYWRVRGRHSQDISQWSSVWSFTTQYELTTPPTLSSPSNASTDIPYSNLNLIWNSIPNVNSYQYQVSENASFTQVVKSGNTSLTFTSITNLYPATVYYWRVRGENENGYSPWSDVWSFTTQSVTLDPPQLISPADGSIVTNSDVNLTWGSVFGASGYTIQVSLNNDFAAGTSTFNTSNTSYTVTGFPFNLTFFWRVRATDAFNEGDWSEVWSFSTVEPTLSPPNLILPLNSSSDLDFSETTFEWSIVDGATLYTIEITDSDFGPDAFTISVTTNTYTAAWLSCETSYQWRVKASNGTLISDWSEVWSFTTAECEVILDAPVLISPSNESTGIDASDVMFEWNAVAGATGYTIEVSDGEFGPMSYISNVTTTTHNITSLSCGTTYNWRVRASKDSDFSDWSDVWIFASTPCSGINANQIERLSIYPNPAKDEIFIHADDSFKGSRVEVYNVLGGHVKVQIYESNRIDISQLKAGVYLVVIKNSSGVFGQAKFIVQ